MHKNHIFFTHTLIKSILKENDNVIDCTLGNGLDTLFFAGLVKKGLIFCYDIQKKAIKNATNLLNENIKKNILKNITFFQKSHVSFEDIPKNIPISLIIYNLGYLPKGDKSITTKASTTIKSIENALNLIKPKGSIFITIYPGHMEGEKEKKEILFFLNKIKNKAFSIYHFENILYEKAPSTIWIQKK